MNDCYLNFLVSFRALFSLDVGANLVNSKQTIGIILPDLSLLGYAVPVESFGIGLFVILFTYLIIEYNVQLLSHEKFKIAMNMLHTAHTPLILLRNQLEELKTGNLPEPLSQQVEEALGYAECIIYCNRNIATLNKVNKRIPPKTSTVNLELSTYVTSIVNQCRAHANSRQIRLTVGECSDCVSCRINENIMTAALQHLINKMILISESGCCISINVTHTMNSWQLQISNNEIAGQRAGKMFPFIPIIFPVYGYSDLWTVRKIIRLHGGKITGCRHGKAADYQSKAVEMGIQGEIITGFTISKSKKIINSRIIKGLCMDLDKEVLQTIKKMPVWKLSEDNVDYKIIINFVLPDGCSVLEPRVSVVGIETGSQKFTVKRMNGINCGSMAVYGVHDAGGDSIFSKTITIINEDTNR